MLPQAGRAAAPIKPVEMVRTLQMLQDQMAHGSSAAQAEQLRLVAHIAQAFLAAEPDTWTNAQNSRAAAVYVMSGGSPLMVRRLLDLGDAVHLDADMLNGILAYLEGRNSQAKSLLDPIDARTQYASLAAPLALIQATLAAESDPARALALLDFARLSAPGTLIEESALRRAIAAAGLLGDRERFRSLCGQYMRRFHASVYAEAFRAQFADLFLQLDPIGGPESLATLDEMLADLPSARRLSLYLSVARAALQRGMTAAAAHASEQANALAGDGGDETSRGVLYRAAAGLLGDGLDRAMVDLAALDPETLRKDDREIRDAALELGGRITAWPEEPGEPPPQDTSDAAEQAVLASIGRAREAMASVETLLEAVN
jgi:chemotaxis protein MotC